MAHRELVINEEDFPSNSAKKEQVVVEKIEIEGNVKQKKKSLGKKINETLFDEDAKSVGMYIFEDVFLPTLKNLISDIITNGINAMLFGEGKPANSNVRRDRGRSYVSYNSYYEDRRDRGGHRQLDRGRRARHDFDEVIFDRRSDAEKVLSRLIDVVEEYDQVSVADFYDFVDIESSYTDRNWGWDNLRDAYVDRVRNGYIIVFPRTVVLD